MKKFLGYIWRTIKSKDMPVWLTLIVFSIGVIATYLIAPEINKEFEKEKIKTSYIINNLKTFHNSTGDFVSFVNTYRKVLESGGASSPTLITKLENLSARLQWKVIEYDLIFSSRDSKREIEIYQKNLSSLTKKISGATENSDVPEIVCLTRNFIYSSHSILTILAKISDINLDMQPVFEIPKNLDCSVLDKNRPK